MTAGNMIVLVTDFGSSGPYVGQMRAVLERRALGVPVVELFSDAPAFDPRATAYLLAAYTAESMAGDVFLCVVDPGVGGARRPLVLQADGRWFVGPDNGLFAIVARRADAARVWEITWRPDGLSSTFHGRDLFAPVAALLAGGAPGGAAVPGEPPGVPLTTADIARPDWPDDLAVVVYVDHFGNAMTGLRAAGLAPAARPRVGDEVLERAQTFSDRPPGTAFWYENANGLVEIAVNQGRADAALGLAVGDPVAVES